MSNPIGEITKIQLKTKISRNDSKVLCVKCALSNIYPDNQKPATLKVNGIEKEVHQGYTEGPIKWTEWDENYTVTIELMTGYAVYCFGDDGEILTSWIPFEKNVPITFYNANRDLASITLDQGEPLVNIEDKTLIVGGAAHTAQTTNYANNENNIILGASRTELGEASNNTIDIKHIDNIERSSYTLKTKGATLTEKDNIIEINAEYTLDIEHDNIANDTKITLTSPDGSQIEDTIADPDWDTKVLNRPVVHWVGDDVSQASDVIASVSSDVFTYKTDEDGNSLETQLHHYDICINKQKIGDTDHYEHTIYIYDAVKSSWQKLNSEYDAKNVIFDSDISITKNFGKYSGSDTQLGTILSKGKSIFEVIEDAFGGDDNTVWETKPSASAKAEVSAFSAEVGQNITFKYVVTLDTGTYKHGTRTDTSYTLSDKTTGIKYSKVSNSYVDGNLVSNDAILSTKTVTVVEGLNGHTFKAQKIYRSAISKHPCSLKGSDIYDNLESEYKSQQELDLGSKNNSCTGYRYWYVSSSASTQSGTCASNNKTTDSEKSLGGVNSGSNITVACRDNKTPKLYTYDDFNKSWELVSGAFSSGTDIFVRPENQRATNGGQVVYTSSGKDADKYKYYTYSVVSSATYKVTIS